jgi:ATP-binding cassette subfamily F protein 3
VLQLRNLTLARGARRLLEDVSLQLHAGWRTGLVGPNGSGKSSLFALLGGELVGESGTCSVPTHWRIATVAQETSALDRSALDFVLDGDDELRAIEQALADAERADDGTRLGELHERYAALDGYGAKARAASLLAGLGFENADLERGVAEFSGGWRMRLNLGRALASRADLLLLDEPTNHLDLDAVVWLERWLSSFRGTLLVVSHDRDFLDGCVTHIASIEDTRLTLYTGNYSSYETQRAARLALQQAMHARQQREMAHVMQFVARFRAKASKARQVQSRLKALERLERVSAAHVDSPFDFEFPEPARAPDPLLTLEGVTAGYDGRRVLSDVQWSLRPGARVGLLGPNGAGKSTLVKTLVGELAPLADAASRRTACRSATLRSISSSSSTATRHRSRISPGSSRGPARASCVAGSVTSTSAAITPTHASGSCRAARNRDSRSRCWCASARTSCCSTSRPITSTSRCATR